MNIPRRRRFPYTPITRAARPKRLNERLDGAIYDYKTGDQVHTFEAIVGQRMNIELPADLPDGMYALSISDGAEWRSTDPFMYMRNPDMAPKLVHITFDLVDMRW